ncbi:MAG: T9SS type A sorting domain-containing protein [Chitinophagaceae bacterium]|nr:T9SS type A sorting domain-containing protein [Chitinophagaceae bacterium]
MRSLFTFLLFVCSVSLIHAQNATPVTKATLPPELEEISGMIHLNGKLYGHADSQNDPIIYEFDSTSGAVTKTITLGVTNSDWEDITHDGTYIYVADIGNNNGTKSVLRFYKFPIQAIEDITGDAGTIPLEQIETIKFTYSDYVSSKAFDCEAVFYHDGYLHLFTKNWIAPVNTVHYRLQVPAAPTGATLIAERLEEFDTQDILVTGATLMNDRIVALLGYNDRAVYGFSTACAMWLIQGFDDINNIFSEQSNKQKINLGFAASLGQLESITAVSQTRVLLANENTLGIVPQRLYGLNLDGFISQELLPFGINNFTSRLTDNQVLLIWEYNEPGAAYFEVEAAKATDGSYSFLGRVYSNALNDIYTFTDNSLGDATVKYYRIKLVTPDGKAYYSKTLQVKKDDSKMFNLLAMPSPFTSSLHVSFYSDTDQVVRLSIVDMHGRAVSTRQLQTGRGRYHFSLDELQGLGKGVYFLTARTKKDLFVRKIMKQ